jgi:hypothetical protein
MLLSNKSDKKGENMHVIKEKWLFMALVFFTVSLTFSFAGGDVEVSLPIDQVQGLISQLEQAATNVAGQAGIEVRASIAKLSSELEARLNQINQMGKDWWKMMYNDLSTELNHVMQFLKDYLKEVDNMIAKNIQIINTSLAQRIDQINDAITDRLGQVDSIVQRAIVAAQNAAINVINQGEHSVLIIIDSFIKSLVRMIVVTVLVILFVIIGVLAWKSILPKKAPQIVVSAAVLAILFVGSGFLLFSDKALAALFGHGIAVTNPQVALSTADKGHADFIGNVNTGASRKDLVVNSKVALNKLIAAKYFVQTDKDKAEIAKKIAEINVLLYPPPQPEPRPSANASVALGLSSKYYPQQVTALKSVAAQLKVQPEKLYFSPQLMELNKPLLRIIN